jgi:amidophosphoribosyltransferase
LNTIGAKFVRDVKPGEVIKIDSEGIHSSFYAKPKKRQQLGSMELIYFARPDSIIDGINVHEFRKKTGIKLAQLFPVKEADMVIPIPDSAISATLGYSEESKIPYERGLIKNRYISRTFIQVDQKKRTSSVRKKLNAVPHIVGGKDIVLIDDSIVRGTTIKQIIMLLREAGAKKIHVRVASPKIIAPSYYGINISTYSELLAHHYPSSDDMAKFIGADSLKYLPVKELEKLAKPVGLDLSIFTDKRVTNISQEYLDIANQTKNTKGII